MSRPVNIIANGNAQVDTAESKFGGASLLLDGSSQTCLTIDDTSFAFGGSETFTLEMFFNADSISGGFQYLYSANWYQFGGASFVLAYSNGKIVFQTTNDGQTNSGYAEITGVAANTWHHVALTFDAGDFQLFLNGTRESNQTGVLMFTSLSPRDPIIGASTFKGDEFEGHIDEIRISNNVRYSGSTYSVPTTAFGNDANTLLLLHCDGADGSTTFTDDDSAPAVPTPKNLSVTNITATGARLNWEPGP